MDRSITAGTCMILGGNHVGMDLLGAVHRWLRNSDLKDTKVMLDEVS